MSDPLTAKVANGCEEGMFSSISLLAKICNGKANYLPKILINTKVKDKRSQVPSTHTDSF